MEQIKNARPPYQMRLGDLRSWHVVTATCSACRHQGQLSIEALCWERAEATRLGELQPKLRCCRCRNRTNNSLSVTLAPRD